jgi:hypothetical protein
MASKDPLSQSTGYNGIHGDYYSCVTFDNLTEDNEVYVVLYYPLYSEWDFPDICFFSRNQTRGHAGQSQDSNKTV